MLASCGRTSTYDVRSESVGDETTQDILVFTPEVDGSWPVLVLLHGLNGVAGAMTESGTRLAAEGVVVFAPTYRTDMSSEQGLADLQSDLTCAFRYAVDNAERYGGDLDQPLTLVGWSLGATFSLTGGLTSDDPPVACGSEVPFADIVVAVSGCHYEFEGARFTFDPSGWGNKDAKVILLAGEDDTTCAAWQSEDAADALRSVGYDVDLEILEGAEHAAPVFHELVGDEFILTPDDPAGNRTVEVIVDAIRAETNG